MQRITVRQARPGMVLERSIVDPRDEQRVLLEKGRTLDLAGLVALHEAGVFDLWTHWPGLEQLEWFSSSQFSESARLLGDALRQGFINISTLLGQDQFTASEQYANILAHAVFQDAQRCLGHRDCATPTEAVLRHGAEVAMLSMLLAHHLEGYVNQERRASAQHQGNDLIRLGLGGLLHDLGELRLDEGLRESQKDLLEQDLLDAAWQVHPTLGYEMVRRQIDPVAASIVLNHHRHFDGSGFAGFQAGREQAAICGKRLHVFWRLVMAADTLLHLRQRHGAPMPMVYALYQIQQQPIVDWFDPVILAGLLEAVPAFPEGTLVQLSDGRAALVEQYDPTMPCCPVVRVLAASEVRFMDDHAAEISGTGYVDLRQDSSRWIHRVDGVEVSGYLYGRMPEGNARRSVYSPDLAVAV